MPGDILPSGQGGLHRRQQRVGETGPPVQVGEAPRIAHGPGHAGMVLAGQVGEGGEGELGPPGQHGAQDQSGGQLVA